jgi:hypothetical protein
MSVLFRIRKSVMPPLLRLLPWLPMFAISLALSACASEGGGAGPGNGPLRLMPHDSATLAPGVTLTYDSVSDSRCPPGVKCIWAGRLDYRFTLKSGNTVENFSLAPDKASHTSALLPGQRIELDTSAIPAAAQPPVAADKQPVLIRLVRA